MPGPFDDTDGPDWRPETCADEVLNSGSTIESSMDSYYLDDDGNPEWDETDRATVEDMIAELKRQQAE